MTRSQAQEWASRGIRFNAVAPQTMGLFSPNPCGEPDIAALALHLASGRGKELSGHVFEAEVV
jgi:3-oxoacyl-[acyl-carrier protein] reductase